MRTALVLLVMLCAGSARAADQPDASALMQLATVAHKHAQETKDPKDYEKAAGLYEQYFAKPDHPEEHAMSFYYAELLFRLQRYDDAAKYYQRTVTVDPKGKFAQEAAYAYVVSVKNTMKPDAPDGGAPCPDQKPCAIPPEQQRLIDAFDLYLKVVPNSPDPNMAYRRARVFYEYNHFAEAAPQFDHIVVAYPQNELAIYSANLEMDCLALLKRHGELRALVDRVKKNPTLMKDATTQQQVRDNDAALKKLGKVKLAELDGETLARAQMGDRDAFGALYERYADVVYAFVRRMLGDDAAAEDALQDTFMRVARSLPSFSVDGSAALSTWILTLARRAALTPRRPPIAHSSDERRMHEAAVAPASIELGAVRRRLEAALGALSPEQRAVFVLRELSQLSYDEIAVAVGVDVGTVRSRLHRARAALQASLADLLDSKPEDGRGRKIGR